MSEYYDNAADHAGYEPHGDYQEQVHHVLEEIGDKIEHLSEQYGTHEEPAQHEPQAEEYKADEYKGEEPKADEYPAGEYKVEDYHAEPHKEDDYKGEIAYTRN